ncbi:MAG: hypothetical protein FWE29_05365 [Defluviitaleaceae bacterium]|nr:hypothetical protein [Defluviitaleaceae bacterium]
MKNFFAKVMAIIMLVTSLPLSQFGGINTVEASVPQFTVTPGQSLLRSSQVGIPTPVPNLVPPPPVAGRALLQWPLNLNNSYTLTYSLEEGLNITLTLERVVLPGSQLVGPSLGGQIAYRVSYTVTDSGGNPVGSAFQVWQFTDGGVGGFVSPNPPGPYLHYDVADPGLRTPSLNHPLVPASFVGPVFTIRQNEGFTFMFENREVSFFWAPNNVFHYSIGDTTNGGLMGLQSGVIHEFALDTTGSAVTTYRRVLSELDITSAPTAWLNEAPAGRVKRDRIVDYALDSLAFEPGIELTIGLPTFLRSTGTMHTMATLPAGINFNNVRANVTLSDPHPSIGTISLTLDNILSATPAPSIFSLTPGVIAAPPGLTVAGGAIVIDLINAPGSQHIQPSSMYRSSMSTVVGMPPANSLISTQGGTSLRGVYTFLGYEFIDDRDGTPLIRVTPFPGMSGLYRLFHDLHFGGAALIPAQTISAPASGTFTFSVPQAAMGRPYFRIDFSPHDVWPINPGQGDIFQSQTVRSEEWAHRIGAPMHFEIDRDNIVLRSVALPPVWQTAELNLPISWDIGRRDAVLHLIDTAPNVGEYHLRYELQWSDITDMPPANLMETIDIVVRRATGLGSGPYDIEVELTGSDFIGAMPPFILTPQPLPATGAQHFVINSGFNIAADDFIELLQVPAHRREAGAGTVPMLYYPGVFFFRMVLVGVGNNPMDPSFIIEGGGRPSLLEDVTLSALDDAAVPPIENLRAFDPITTNGDIAAGTVDEVSFKASWSLNGSRLSEYVRLSSLIDPLFTGRDSSGVPLPPLDPNDPDFVNLANLEVEMNVYISQDEDIIVDFTTDALLDERISESILFEVDPATPVDAFGYYTEFVFSEINSKLPMTSPVDPSIDARDVLRQGEVVRINIPLIRYDVINLINDNQLLLSNFEFLFDGLDKNQTYFIAVDIVVRESNPDPWFDPPLGGDSITGVATITTAGDPDVPGPGDKIPPAPVIVEPIEGGSTWAEIRWHRHEYDPTTEIYEYEIIRLRNTQMTGSPSGDFRSIFEGLPQNTNPDLLNRMGWRTNLTTPPLPVNYSNRLLLFDESATPSDFRSLEHIEADTVWVYDGTDASYHIFRDNSLRPNQLYFYYIRTRRTLINEDGSFGDTQYSIWERATYTSTPVEAPRDLRLAFVEYGRLPQSRPYDRRFEVIIAFEAAVDLSSGDRLFYSIREGDGSWSEDFEFVVSRNPFTSQQILPTPTNITVDEDGFITFMHRISGLSPGRDYSIRVRAQDATGSMSLYTNILTYRTNMDQDDFDNDRRFTDWNYRLNQELDRLARQPMYVLTNTSAVFTTWYRPSMFDSLMVGSPNVAINLPSGEGTTSIFYIPQSIIQAANRAERGFRITRGNLEVTIPTRAFSVPDNDVMREMDRRIRERDISDYYVRITVAWNDALNAPMGINHTVNITAAGVGSYATAAALETQFNSIMLAAIESAKQNNNIHEQLRDLIRNNTPAEDIIKYIDTVVRDVKNGVSADLNRRVINTRTNPAAMQTVDRPLFISAQNIGQGMAANGFFYERGGVGVTGWRPRSAMNIGNGRGIQAAALGLYGFDIRELVLPNIGAVENAPVATGIVARHGLDAVFGSGSSFDLNRNVSRDQVVNSIATIMGMPRGGNGYDFLRNRGYNVSTRNGGGNITTQEAIHITMMLYEVRSGVRVSAIQIRNQAATANIQGIDNAFRQSIRAAFELGIYTNRNMRPNDPISLQDFLQMLTNMDAVVRI